jgi:hypothetical protein
MQQIIKISKLPLVNERLRYNILRSGDIGGRMWYGAGLVMLFVLVWLGTGTVSHMSQGANKAETVWDLVEDVQDGGIVGKDTRGGGSLLSLPPISQYILQFTVITI